MSSKDFKKLADLSGEERSDLALMIEIFNHEVVETAGCTEVGMVAFISATARAVIEEKKNGKIQTSKIKLTLDPGTFKNGFNAGVPGTEGKKGFPIAITLGLISGNRKNGLLALDNVNSDSLQKAEEIIRKGNIEIKSEPKWKGGLKAKIVIESNLGNVSVLINGGHTNITEIIINGEIIKNADISHSNTGNYKEELRKKSLADLIGMCRLVHAGNLNYHLIHGFMVNDDLSERGSEISSTARNLREMVESGILPDNIVSEIKIKVASAVQARMEQGFTAMSSGCSGNQGNVAILVPALYGNRFCNFDHSKVIESLALSHLLNAYVKCFTGDLSAMCGCAVGAGVGATVAIIYQNNGGVYHMERAIKYIIGTIAGEFCDGASSGCAAKAVIAIDAIFLAVYFAEYGSNKDEDFCNIAQGSAEEAIKAMGKIATKGMEGVDEEIINIMKG
ncbi:serine dehydratase subunit alpha family protein [Candidatus Parcubacteria bacterium]|nr:serine dehydratase subunit alpha family protein [Candidatus Parcubacteria bacterium]